MPRLNSAPGERDDRIGLRIRPDFGARLRNFALATGRTLTEVVETATEEYIQHHEKNTEKVAETA